MVEKKSNKANGFDDRNFYEDIEKLKKRAKKNKGKEIPNIPPFLKFYGNKKIDAEK